MNGETLIDLRSQSVVVVGGAYGIGRACVERFATWGARVLLADVDAEGKAIADEARRGGLEVEFAQVDATEPDDLAAMVQIARERHGTVDSLVTTVGGAHPRAVVDSDVRSWDAELRHNLTSVFLVCRAVLPVMIEERRGSIVTSASTYGVKPGPGRSAYAAAKAGVISFTRSLASEVATDGIRANVLAPGPTDTERFRRLLGEEEAERIRSAVPLGRLGRPEDCAHAVGYLISDLASHVTGQVIHVNGGNFMP